MRKRILLFNLLGLFVLFSCNNKPTEEKLAENSLIEITKAQFQSEGMVFGTPQRVAMDERIAFTGKITSGLNGVTRVSAPVEGIIKIIHIQQGQAVKANHALLEIGGSALLDLQQAFTSSSARIKLLKSDYERVKTLYAENIKTENEYMLAESNYKTELANFSTLKLKLQNIRLNIADIENGTYASTYCITTPIEGIISLINYYPGQYVNPEQEIVEVVNKGNMELQLALFEKDYSKIAPGQKVVFRSMGQTAQDAMATISRVGGILRTNSNTIECFATISKTNTTPFAINQQVSGEVVLASNLALAVPQTAILSSGKNDYVLVKATEETESYMFQKFKVKTGKVYNGFVELIDAPADMIILTSGIYNISLE